MVYCLPYHLNMEIEVTCSSETSFDFKVAARCYFAGNITQFNLRDFRHYLQPIELMYSCLVLSA
jgi:hypothetical protein